MGLQRVGHDLVMEQQFTGYVILVKVVPCPLPFCSIATENLSVFHSTPDCSVCLTVVVGLEFSASLASYMQQDSSFVSGGHSKVPRIKSLVFPNSISIADPCF